MTEHLHTGEIGTESQYAPHSREEIREAALGLISGNVVGSWQIPSHEENILPTIFLPLIAIDALEMKRWKRDGIVHIYGHLRDAGSRSINGWPIFMKFRTVNEDDLKRIIKMAKAFQELEEEDEPA